MTAAALEGVHVGYVPAPPDLARGLTLTATPAKPTLYTWAVHSSGRFDRPVDTLAASVRRLRALPGKYPVAVVTGTEASGRTNADDATFLGGRAHWPYIHLDGTRGHSECWATFDDRLHQLAGRPYARALTDLTWTRAPEYGGGKAAIVHALVVPLAPVGRPHRRRKYFIVVHMPLDNTELRAAIWRDCAAGLVDLGAEIRETDPDAELVPVGDWNKNYRLPGERAQIETRIARPLGLAQAWRGHVPAKGGTHGSQLIDGHLAAAKAIAACQLVDDDASSDHRPSRVLLKSRLYPPRRRTR